MNTQDSKKEISVEKIAEMLAHIFFTEIEVSFRKSQIKNKIKDDGDL